MEEAIVQGTRDRVRPVIMTKLTAILGMLPMGLAVAEGAELEAPLATGVIAGLIFHTLVTLVLVPVLYSIFEGIREKRVARKKQLALLICKKENGARRWRTSVLPSNHFIEPNSMTTGESTKGETQRFLCNKILDDCHVAWSH